MPGTVRPAKPNNAYTTARRSLNSLWILLYLLNIVTRDSGAYDSYYFTDKYWPKDKVKINEL